LQVAKKRLDDVSKVHLNNFKSSLLTYVQDKETGTFKVDKFRLRVDDALQIQRQKALKEEIEAETKKAVAEALDKVRAEESAKAQTGMMSRFFG
jgi:ABC-type Mn2+/Zn2+ transport system ATPase subunit